MPVEREKNVGTRENEKKTKLKIIFVQKRTSWRAEEGSENEN